MGERRPPDRIVVVGASAGGVEALCTLAAGLPEDLPAAVLVVLHVPPMNRSHLPEIMSRAGALPAVHAEDGEPLTAGKIYVAPPDLHLLVADGHVRLAHGAKENMHRPAVDPLFRSAAAAFGERVVGVVLSGTRADGASGAAAISHRGGKVLVQDPADAVYPDMPLSAIAADHPDDVLPLVELPAAIERLVREPPGEVTMSEIDDLKAETQYAALEKEALDRADELGPSSPFSCPECGGVLREVEDHDMLRFRCRVGHAYAAETLLEGQNGTLETALWIALRALEEQASLARRIGDRLRKKGNEVSASRYDQTLEEVERHADVIRAVLAGRGDAAA